MRLRGIPPEGVPSLSFVGSPNGSIIGSADLPIGMIISVPGQPGPGVAAGGTEGQVLTKASAADFDTEWVTGGGAGINNVVEDTTPQLGGDLDLNSHTVGAATAADLTKLHGTGTLSGNNTGDQDLSSYATTSAVAAGYQPLDSDLSAVAALSPTNDDVVQRKAGAWTSRSMSQLKTDLSLTKTDVGLANVTNNAQYYAGGTDVPITDGGTGVSTLPSGLLKGAGTGAITAATAGTDYYAPSGTDVAVTDGGTGRSTSTTAYGVLAAGTTATGAHQTIAPGTSGHFLKSAGASALPAFAALTADDMVDGTTNHVFTAADDTKLGGIEALADVTDAANVDSAGAVMNSDTSTAAMGFVVDEDAMTSNSATKVPTQQSVKAYVDAAVIGGGGGTVDTVVAGTNIDVDSTDPANPIVSVESLTSADITDFSTAADARIAAASATGSGNLVRATSPTLVTPALGTPASGNLANCTFPTLNQSTTGSAATLTTSRNIDGQAFNGSSNITVIAPGTTAASSKSTPVDADELPLVDSAASNVLKKLTWANLKATLKTYFDTLYVSISGALGTPSSGTLTNCTGLPISGLTSSTSTALGVGSIELGHGSDTTIARSGTGDITVEGNAVYRAGGTDVPVTDGGTGRSTSTTAYGLIAAGTTATGAHQTLAAGATTEVLVGGGASALPAWTTATGSGAPVRATSPTLVTPVLGTPSSGTLTNCTGLPLSGVVDSTSEALGAGSIELGHASDTTLARSAAGVVTIEGIQVSTQASDSTASSSTPTPAVTAPNFQYNVTALAAGATFGAPTGSPQDGWKLLIRIKDNGTARSLAFNAIFRAIGVTLPSTTVISKTLYLGCVYNSVGPTWDVLAVGQEA